LRTQVLGAAASLFGTSQEALGKFDDNEGCANLVYHYESEGQPRILRLSYRPDRSVELIQAELHFVEYLAAGGVHVSPPVPSIHGNLYIYGVCSIRQNFSIGKNSCSNILQKPSC
jgi:Ser/Thr protein kinase RdoA (MazF antagonist)